MTGAPVAKYRLELEVTGNSHAEIHREIEIFLNGDHMAREADAFRVIGGRITAEMTMTNPEQTAEDYERDLHEWWVSRKAKRKDPTP